MQCIRSAEIVLEIRKLISDRGIGGLNYVLSHFMMAAVILAMDVCFNPDEIRVPQRKEEVLRACHALEEELNGKITSCHGSENKTLSSCQLMLKSFHEAVGFDRSGLSPSSPLSLSQLRSSSTSWIFAYQMKRRKLNSIPGSKPTSTSPKERLKESASSNHYFYFYDQARKYCKHDIHPGNHSSARKSITVFPLLNKHLKGSYEWK
jgi:hypothetical protein